MATQNFVAGGFYGKLGAMVGQRWRNKRIVRAYAVPANPRTPSQQGNRARFAQATAAAQEAMIFNKNAPCWNYEGKTEWMARVGEAKTRIDNGVTGWLVVPLYPSGTTPELTVTDIESTTGTHGGLLLQSAALATLTSPRKFTLQVKMMELSSGEMVSVYLEGATEAGSADLVEITPDSGYTLTTDSTIVGITFDDEENDGKIIYIAPQKIDVPSGVTITDATLSYADDTHVLVSSEQARSLAVVYDIDISLALTDGLTGAAKTVTGSSSNTLGGSTLATLEIAATDVLFSNAQATFTVTATPSGAQALTITPATASLGQKEIEVALSGVTASLTAAARKSGAFTANGIYASASNNLALLAKATYRDYKSVDHTGETVATITAQAVTGTGITAALAFNEAPEVFDAATVTVEGNAANTWLKQTFTDGADITDVTQQKLSLTGWSYSTQSDYIDAGVLTSQTIYDILDAKTLAGRVVGQNISTGADATEDATNVYCYTYSVGATRYWVDIETHSTAPVTSGSLSMWCTDFETAATAYYIDCGTNTVLGKVDDMGMEAFNELVTEYQGNFNLVIPTNATAYIAMGNQITPLSTVYSLSGTGNYADDNEGWSCDFSPRGSATVTQGNPVRVPVTATPDSGFNANDINTIYARITIVNDMIDFTYDFEESPE